MPGPQGAPAAVPGWCFNLIPSHSHRLKTDKMRETVTALSALLKPPLPICRLWAVTVIARK